MALDPTCPVCKTAELVCGKWTLLLVRDLAEGRSRFCELERSLSGISPRTLSLRLRGLEEEGIVERHTYPEVPPRPSRPSRPERTATWKSRGGCELRCRVQLLSPGPAGLPSASCPSAD